MWNYDVQAVFLECSVDFDDFQEQAWKSHNGRHVCITVTLTKYLSQIFNSLCVCVCVCVYEKERERKRQTDRQTVRQRQTEREIQGDTERQREILIEGRG